MQPVEAEGEFLIDTLDSRRVLAADHLASEALATFCLSVTLQVLICCAHISSSESPLLSCPKHSNSSNIVKNADYSMLYRCLASTDAHNFRDSVTLGFLGAYGTTPFDLGALPLAVHNVNHNPHLLPGKTVFCPF